MKNPVERVITRGYCCPRCHKWHATPELRLACRRSHATVELKLEVA